jgi:hypothetical protein
MLRKYAEEIPLAVNRIGFSLDQLRILFAVKLAPLVEQGLGNLANLLAANADRIVSGVTTFAGYLVNDFPPMLFRFVAGTTAALADFLTGTGAFLRGLATDAQHVLSVFDEIGQGVQRFAAFLAGTGAFIAQVVANLANSPTGRLVQNVVINHPEAAAGGALALQLGGGAFVGGLSGRAVGGLMGRGIGASAGAAGSQGGGLMSGIGRGAGYLARGAGRLGMAGLRGVGGLLGTTAGAVGAAGIGLGVLGYEGLRGTGLLGQGMPSAYQIGDYYGGRLRDGAMNLIGRGPEYQANMARGQAADASLQQMRNQRMGAGVLLPQTGRNPYDAFTAASGYVSGLQLPSLSGNGSIVNRLAALANGGANMADSGASFLNGISRDASGRADSWAEDLKTIARATRDTATNTMEAAKQAAGLNQALPAAVAGMSSRVMADMAQDISMTTLRR